MRALGSPHEGSFIIEPERESRIVYRRESEYRCFSTNKNNNNNKSTEAQYWIQMKQGEDTRTRTHVAEKNTLTQMIEDEVWLMDKWASEDKICLWWEREREIREKVLWLPAIWIPWREKYLKYARRQKSHIHTVSFTTVHWNTHTHNQQHCTCQRSWTVKVKCVHSLTH